MGEDAMSIDCKIDLTAVVCFARQENPMSYNQ